MEQYIEYLRKSRFDRDYLDLSVEETLKRHQEILDRLARDVHFRSSFLLTQTLMVDEPDRFKLIQRQ